MIKRDYYSVRTGKITPDNEINFEVLKKLFSLSYTKLYNEGYFQKYFGFYCPDGDVLGELGGEIETIMFVSLKKYNLYPILNKLPDYSEDDMFDVIEFLHDHCSKGLEGYYHSYDYCGYHYKKFDDQQGQKYFREICNPFLRNYKSGFEISELGEVLMLADNGLANLFEADIPTNDQDNISNKMNAAIMKFRRYRSTYEDRKEAIRELADVLEFLRPDIKRVLDKKDENDIFNIANNFGIRHHNKDQQIDYNKAVWYSWIFYYYLATLHAVLRLIEIKRK